MNNSINNGNSKKKQSYENRNLNASLKTGQTTSTVISSSSKLITIGKTKTNSKSLGVAAAPTPTPVNTASLRKENNGKDINVTLIPQGYNNGVWGQSANESTKSSEVVTEVSVSVSTTTIVSSSTSTTTTSVWAEKTTEERTKRESKIKNWAEESDSDEEPESETSVSTPLYALSPQIQSAKLAEVPSFPDGRLPSSTVESSGGSWRQQHQHIEVNRRPDHSSNARQRYPSNDVRNLAPSDSTSKDLPKDVTASRWGKVSLRVDNPPQSVDENAIQTARQEREEIERKQREERRKQEELHRQEELRSREQEIRERQKRIENPPLIKRTPADEERWERKPLPPPQQKPQPQPIANKNLPIQPNKPEPQTKILGRNPDANKAAYPSRDERSDSITEGNSKNAVQEEVKGRISALQEQSSQIQQPAENLVEDEKNKNSATTEVPSTTQQTQQQQEPPNISVSIFHTEEVVASTDYNMTRAFEIGNEKEKRSGSADPLIPSENHVNPPTEKIEREPVIQHQAHQLPPKVKMLYNPKLGEFVPDETKRDRDRNLPKDRNIKSGPARERRAVEEEDKLKSRIDNDQHVENLNAHKRFLEECRQKRLKDKETRQPRTQGILYAFTETGEIVRVLTEAEKLEKANRVAELKKSGERKKDSLVNGAAAELSESSSIHSQDRELIPSRESEALSSNSTIQLNINSEVVSTANLDLDVEEASKLFQSNFEISSDSQLLVNSTSAYLQNSEFSQIYLPGLGLGNTFNRQSGGVDIWLEGGPSESRLASAFPSSQSKFDDANINWFEYNSKTNINREPAVKTLNDRNQRQPTNIYDNIQDDSEENNVSQQEEEDENNGDNDDREEPMNTPANNPNTSHSKRSDNDWRANKEKGDSFRGRGSRGGRRGGGSPRGRGRGDKPFVREKSQNDNPPQTSTNSSPRVQQDASVKPPQTTNNSTDDARRRPNNSEGGQRGGRRGGGRKHNPNYKGRTVVEEHS